MDEIITNEKDKGYGSVNDLLRLDGALEGEEYLAKEDEEDAEALEELERLDRDESQREADTHESKELPVEESSEFVRVVSVAFRNEGKRLMKCPEGMTFRTGDNVIVETQRGLSMGQVAMPPVDFPSGKLLNRDETIIRIATDIDMDQEAENRMHEREAFLICRQKIGEHGLMMNLVQSEYTFDRTKLLFYFTADGRVDFRELLKDLASTFHTRIELRQIGVRDETKVLGGIGVCGREVCCRTYLKTFAPVSVKMAKEQNLSLNPTKISGICGRLMCCLKNEEETYEYLNRAMPRLGSKVMTKEGEIGVVKSINILKQKASVLFEEDDEREMRVYDVSDLQIKSHRGKKSEAGSEDIENAFSDEGFEAPVVENSDETDVRSDKPQNDRGDKRNKGRKFNKGGGGRHFGGRNNKDRREGGRPSEERPSDNTGRK